LINIATETTAGTTNMRGEKGGSKSTAVMDGIMLHRFDKMVRFMS
jgi:hypothetical protein